VNFDAITLCVASQRVCCCCLFRYRLSPETFGYTLVYHRRGRKRLGRHLTIILTCVAHKRSTEPNDDMLIMNMAGGHDGRCLLCPATLCSHSFV
jgi:hypothetical protein